MQAVMYNPWNLQCRRLNKENIFCEFMNFIFTFLMKILTAGQKEFWYFDELESTLTELCLLGTRFIEKTGNFEDATLPGPPTYCPLSLKSRSFKHPHRL